MRLVDIAGLAFERDEHDTGRGAGTLSHNHQTRRAHRIAMGESLHPRRRFKPQAVESRTPQCQRVSSSIHRRRTPEITSVACDSLEETSEDVLWFAEHLEGRAQKNRAGLDEAMPVDGRSPECWSGRWP